MRGPASRCTAAPAKRRQLNLWRAWMGSAPLNAEAALSRGRESGSGYLWKDVPAIQATGGHGNALEA